MTRSLPTRGVRVTLLLALLASLTGHAPAQSGNETLQIEVVGVTGAAARTTDSGKQTLELGMRLSPGDIVVTDGTGRVALGLAAAGDTPDGERDLLLLGSDTQTRLTPVSASDASMAAIVQRGAYRVVVRGTRDTAPFVVRNGSRRLIFERGDYAARYDPASDSAVYMVSSGSMKIQAGNRSIRLNKGLYREIEDGKILGARRLEGSRWKEALAATTIEGVDTTMPKLVAATKPAKSTPPNAITPDQGRSPTAAPTVGNTAPVATGAPAAEDAVYVVVETSMGNIHLELDRGRAPITVANFLAYVNSDHYDGTIFHRVISNFMIQGGGLMPDMNEKQTREPITNEWENGLKNRRGTIAMARLPRQPDSATCQFFINVRDNASLDVARDGAGYAVFGKVVRGMDVVDRIRQVPTQARGFHASAPVKDVVIEDVRVVTAAEATGANAAAND